MATYITPADLRAVVPDQFRDAALADKAGGTQADPGLLQAVIQAASNEVDALIEGRVHLPLSSVPQKLKTAACFLALETLYIRRGIELPKSAADKVTFWRGWLSKVGEGELRLDADAPGASPYKGAIAVRPAITGHGGIIGCLFVLFTIFTSLNAQAVSARTFKFAAPDRDDVFTAADYVEWSQAETVTLTYTGIASEEKEVRWEVSKGNYLWINIASATNTKTSVLFALSPEQSLLPPGSYSGRLAAYSRLGTNIIFHRVIAKQDIRVHQGTIGQTLPPRDESDPIATPIAEEAVAAISTHKKNTNNPHDVTASQVGAWPVGAAVTNAEDSVARMDAQGAVQSIGALSNFVNSSMVAISNSIQSTNGLASTNWVVNYHQSNKQDLSGYLTKAEYSPFAADLGNKVNSNTVAIAANSNALAARITATSNSLVNYTPVPAFNAATSSIWAAMTTQSGSLTNIGFGLVGDGKAEPLCVSQEDVFSGTGIHIGGGLVRELEGLGRMIDLDCGDFRGDWRFYNAPTLDSTGDRFATIADITIKNTDAGWGLLKTNNILAGVLSVDPTLIVSHDWQEHFYQDELRKIEEELAQEASANIKTLRLNEWAEWAHAAEQITRFGSAVDAIPSGAGTYYRASISNAQSGISLVVGKSIDVDGGGSVLEYITLKTPPSNRYRYVSNVLSCEITGLLDHDPKVSARHYELTMSTNDVIWEYSGFSWLPVSNLKMLLTSDSTTYWDYRPPTPSVWHDITATDGAGVVVTNYRLLPNFSPVSGQTRYNSVVHCPSNTNIDISKLTINVKSTNSQITTCFAVNSFTFDRQKLSEILEKQMQGNLYYDTVFNGPDAIIGTSTWMAPGVQSAHHGALTCYYEGTPHLHYRSQGKFFFRDPWSPSTYPLGGAEVTIGVRTAKRNVFSHFDNPPKTPKLAINWNPTMLTTQGEDPRNLPQPRIHMSTNNAGYLSISAWFPSWIEEVWFENNGTDDLDIFEMSAGMFPAMADGGQQ